ncbi:MAG: tetratricopeptide repeat protein [Enterovibrio sp.]
MAQYKIGIMYADGIGVAKDEKQAFYWYRKAAEQGYPEAQFALGAMYASGRGVDMDQKKAVHWFRKAAG